MQEDLFRALLPIPCPIVIVTNSARTAARLDGTGWRILWENDQTSESESVDTASRLLSAEGVEAVLRLPADLPLVQTEDIAGLLSQPIEAPGAILVPSWDKRGTNALLRTPPGVFPSRFGPDSFALHVREARAAGAHLQILESPRLALDLDDAADIARFLARPAPGETYQALSDLHIKERLVPHAG
jgi:2-phospho-L-lactate guanylyltransferase